VNRRVLVVTYFFPPVGGVGVQRTLKYVTYLPRWGWEPVVVAPRDPAFPVRDPSLLATLAPGLEVHRTASLEPGRLPSVAARLLSRRTGNSAGSLRSAGSTAVAGDLTASSARGSVPLRVLRKLSVVWNRVWAVLLFPDGSVAWMPFALRAGVRAGRGNGCDVIYSSAAPISTHLAAGLIRRRIHKPWVADFRDPWIGNAFAAPMSRPKRWLQRRMERWIVTRADRVIVAVDAMRVQFEERYPELAGKFVHIPNGYDRSDLIGVEPAPPPQPGGFHLLYAGSLYRPKELEAFLLGVERLLARRPDLRARLRVDFVGRVNDANARAAAEFDTPERLGGVIGFEGFMPRSKALARMAGADALLQLMPDIAGAEIFVGGKLSEYLAFDRPILAVMPRGEGRALVESLPTGIAADVEPGSVADALERLLDHTPAPAPADPAGRFDRINLAGELARELDGVAGG
jgi:glycosyltransferase involved in cell wall biosynthesis